MTQKEMENMLVIDRRHIAANNLCAHFSPSANTLAFVSNVLLQRLSSGSGTTITLLTDDMAEAVVDFSLSQCTVWKNDRGNGKGNIRLGYRV
jgi:hypothetical protein